MEYLYIFGNSGYARETFYLVKSLNRYDICAFVDIHSGENVMLGDNIVPVISEDDFEIILQKNGVNKVNAVISIADAHIARKIYNRFKGKCKYPNIVSPLALCYERVRMGEGNIISPYCFFTVNVKMGSFNKFNFGVGVGHDVTIGDFNQFNSSVNLSGHVTVGSCNLFGVKSTVLQGLKIGDNNTVGASSLLIKSIHSERIYIGVPAKKVDL
ncbi:MAG: acetyltransferase [Parabacteroides sp.]|nr:acetyltransferase [Parabacteroides sp.]